MNYFMLPALQRTKVWGTLRDDLTNYEPTAQMEKVVGFWSLCPFSKLTINKSEPSSWPTPWEMLSRGNYCQASISIGMEATLRLGGWEASRLHLATLADGLMILIIDNQFVLNYSYGEVIDVDKLESPIVARYQWTGREYAES